ncbi:ATP-binding protein [Candidatus Micrarchaeota archaeon]|nr:ATP-binding protein [Candidatus Micrarchaeota archaeon]
MRLGGIPQYVLTEDEDYLNELVEGIIYKDIIAYHKIENEKAVKELFSLLCRRVGKPTSYNKLSKILGVSVDSVKRYVGYFEKAYLFHVVDRYAASLNESIASPKKIYAGDVGIKNLAAGGKDVGASYENLVFLKIQQDRQIKRRNRPVLLNSKPRKRVGKLSWFAIKDEKPVIGYFSENGVEIDFVTRDAAIEAKYGQKPTEKQDQVLESFKKKKDVIVASGLDFFLKKY